VIDGAVSLPGDARTPGTVKLVSDVILEGDDGCPLAGTDLRSIMTGHRESSGDVTTRP